ncbi:MAG: YihA family ribosome biogenesis GTP-binding protein [Clostridia bacterium]|nr:YihA family ribosome biogenesis GTP-binding protein [Clostridia bacterium]
MEQAKQDTLMIKNATFITSAGRVDQFLKPQKPTVAICGKSNVGKSSFINMMANRKQLAKTSRDPGRTRLVNYFDFGEFVLADLPGYGFARVSKTEKDKWGKLLDAYFKDKGNLTHALVLVDCRHSPTEDDKQMMQFLHYYTIPFTVVLTKADKLSKMKLKEQIRKIAGELYLGVENVIATSAESGYGKEEVLKKLRHVIDVANEEEYVEEDELEEEQE